MKRVAFYTLGCKLNFSETSTISRMFEKKGYQRVGFQDPADIFVINTCSVTDNADKKCKKVVREALKYSPDAFIAIVGCYAQLKPSEIAEIPGVDAVLGASEKFQLIDLLDGFKKKSQPQVYSSNIQEAQSFHHAYSLHDRTRTFLKVQDGCNYNCSFCTIPLARGKSRSASIKKVVEDAQSIARSGVKEVVLSGVNIGDFGIQAGKRKERFLDLIKALESVEGIERFRISSIEPNLLHHEIIAWMAGSNKFVPHFHIPLQSGSDKILQLMHRRYDTELYAERIQQIKSLMPHCCIGVDVIVGFPGETEEDFQATYRFLNELDISYLHVFSYSERPGTKATTMTASVPQTIRDTRSNMLRILSVKKRRKFYEENLGTSQRVLFEDDPEQGLMKGFTENYIRVEAPYDPLLINEIQLMRLNRINASGHMVGEEIYSQSVVQ